MNQLAELYELLVSAYSSEADQLHSQAQKWQDVVATVAGINSCLVKVANAAEGICSRTNPQLVVNATKLAHMAFDVLTTHMTAVIEHLNVQLLE